MTIPQDVAADPWQIVADLQQQIAASHAEREALELALRNSEERYSLAMRAINEGFYEWDVATSEMHYSPRVCELVGLPPEELRTMADWTNRIHPTDMLKFRQAILAHFNGETEWLEAEYRYRHADGTWHWARHHGIGLRNEAGRVYRVVGSTGDITAQRAAEEALRESLEQQTATAEVLQVINSSPGDLAPVFDAMLERAIRLCEATYGHMFTYDGELFHLASISGPPRYVEWSSQLGPVRSGPSAPLGRISRGERIVHVADIQEEDVYHTSPGFREQADRRGVRSQITIALFKDDVLLGAMVVYRQEVRPFTDKQIALLQNFAAQAVIAMENARLLTETREALEQQTATAEVLEVINSSPGDLAPVFDAMLEKGMRLCCAVHGDLFVYDGDLFHLAATHGEEGFSEWLRQQGPIRAWPGSPGERLLQGEVYVHWHDPLQEPSLELVPELLEQAKIAGVRTSLFIPLRKEEVLLGMIVVYRLEVRPFTDKQIALLQNFAAQAVIAMENARLLTETREALQQQTATSEVLQVINSSPGDLTPVFDAMLEKAMALCGVTHGSLQTYDGEQFRAVAVRGHPEPLAALLRQGYRLPAEHPTLRLLEGDRFVQIPDLTQVAPGLGPVVRTAVEAGSRTLLSIPLRKDDVLVGKIVAVRREVRPFSEKEIALLENFAAQAVIAMENARLITETREALEQQTATAEVLQVINSSPGDLAPVFDTMLEKAMRLCEAVFGTLLAYDGERFSPAAACGTPVALAEWQMRQSLVFGPGTGPAQIVSGENLVHTIDLMTTEAYRRGDPARRALVELGGARTHLIVALRKENALLGTIAVYRQEVRPFTDKQIALLQNFAAQAVIAMENARLLNETRDALEQQTATAEVLQVINSSPGDLAPVFDAMLDKAIRLCEATQGHLLTFDGECFHWAAATGELGYVEWTRRIGAFRPPPGGPLGRITRGERVVHIADVREEEVYLTVPAFREQAELRGTRSQIAVGLLKDNILLGAMIVYRQEVRPFSDKQIALLQNFAAQAVIAMENARLLDEIRQRQQELRVTFDNMVDGVAMFDEALRLAAWNRNFQELLKLPDEFLAQRPDLDTYIRYLVERREFGETEPETQIARLRARIGDHYSFERTRPNGTVIEVRHNPMPGGGIVLIYSDITARKRSEAEIKAARDTAEAAYLDLKAAQASLVHAEKMASLGQLTAGIAHEIKNPLNFVNNFAGLSVELLDELKETATPAISAMDNDKRAEIDETIDMLSGNLEKIAEHGKRADNIVTSMLEHSRGSSGERRSVALNGLIEEALNLAYHGGRAQDQSFNITLERDYADTIAPIELVPQDITRVCLNLFGNGFYAATKRQKEGSDASFKPTLKVSTRDLADAVEIQVRDNGIGIPPENKDKLFQPFFTTKPTGEGTGLGLSISYDIVTQQHGGTIAVDSREGEFTEFTIRLPRSGQAAGRSA